MSATRDIASVQAEISKVATAAQTLGRLERAHDKSNPTATDVRIPAYVSHNSKEPKFLC